MPFCSFDKDGALYDATPIENMFLLEYLPTAPDGYLRVYLYARMLCLHPELGEGLEDMARALHIDPEAVYDAMTYWERQGLVRRLTDRPPTYAILPVRGADAVNPMDGDYYEYRDFNGNLQAIFGDNLLHPRQYEMANDWLNILGFTQDAVLKMVEERLRRSRSKRPDLTRFFNKLNETAVEWADRGVRTAEDVARALETDGRVEKTAAAVMKQFSMHRQPTVDELKLVNKWLDDWSLSHEEVLSACAETTKSRAPTLAYLDAVLEKRRKGGGELFEGAKAALTELGAGERPTPEQERLYGEWLKQGFEPQTVCLAAAQCARKRKHRFEDLEWMLGKWAELNLFKFDAADAYVRDMSRATDEVRALLNRCGSDRRPQMDDLALYESWRANYPRELIDYAADCARGMQLPMRYIDKLLEQWARSGVTTLADAQAQHAAHGASAPQGGAVNPALDYDQRAYNEEDYAGLYLDLTGDVYGGEKA